MGAKGSFQSHPVRGELAKGAPSLRAFVHHASAALVQWQANRAFLFQPKIKVDAM